MSNFYNNIYNGIIKKPINIINSDLINFYNFLNDNKIFGTTIGVVIAFQIRDFWTSLIQNIINPITIRLFNKNIKQVNISFFDMTFYIGQTFIELLNLLISLFLLYLVYSYAQKYGLK